MTVGSKLEAGKEITEKQTLWHGSRHEEPSLTDKGDPEVGICLALQETLSISVYNTYAN